MDREDRREAILDVATDVFLKEGYASASMSTIAAKVGGSKGTLYNYFKSKEELFEAYVQRSCVFHRGEIAHLLTDDGDARTVMTRFAKGYVRAFTAEPALQNWRVISAESHKSPDVGRMFYEAGPLTGARIIAAYIEKARDRGELTVSDVMVAAHHFTSLIHGRLLKARLLAYAPEPSDAEIDAEVEAAMFVFFSAYGAKS
ncbi:MAG TPA: TetR/AcrR family transcriptional regulator [Asticcacaulis sp.]|nr:TetR/AcrR family transcriptional regulator [Asticcacaulis sp.]